MEGNILQKANEAVNDPKCTEEVLVENKKVLIDASLKLRKDDALKKALLSDIRTATKDFRAWEQVSDVYITLEPFAMSNGLLTQSYKVKRNEVSERYKNEL
jgi:long-chain acyl-CoA synthetase